MSSEGISDTNTIIRRSTKLFDLVGRDDLADLLKELDYNWSNNQLNPNAKIVPLLQEQGFFDGDCAEVSLNRLGKLFLGRLLLHFDPGRVGANRLGSLNEKYENFEVVGSGKNAVVIKASHRLLGSKVILKLIRPGASTDIVKSIGKLSHLPAAPAIVLPIDFIEVKTEDILGKPLTISCLVFPLVEGITFKRFLQQENHHLNSQVVVAFARQIGTALRELERIGAYHGDLHEGNILVDQYSKEGIQFRIVDISFDAMGSLPFEVCKNNDLSNFKQHVWRILSRQKSHLPRMSLQKYIGTRNYLRIIQMLSEETTSFADVCRSLESDAEYKKYLIDKKRFIEDHFKSPVSFRLQRYEEITDQTVAVRLFVPFDPLMKKIAGFNNVFVSGNRGSGKSTYLASLAFFPNAEQVIVDYHETFGIYFPCRQGEFRPLSSREWWTKEQDRVLVTNVLIAKIVRRTLEMVAAGVGTGKLSNPNNFGQLRKFIADFVPPPGIVSVDSDIQTELENLVSTMVRVEMEEVGRLTTPRDASAMEKTTRLLLKFFSIIRDTFGELAGTRFHLLFDDAGSPYVPYNVQRVINDLILTSNALFCVKFSAEKFTFDFTNSDGKVLENGQDYFEHDISQILFIGTGYGGLNRAVLEQYFRNIVEQRLTWFGFKSASIVDYLGDELVSVDKLLFLLASGRKYAYYCGWSMVWNIADRTPRNLLEIVSEIFSVGNVDRETRPTVIAQRDQDRAIRTISEKRLESLSQISGIVSIKGKNVSLGRHLYETTTAIGSTFRKYLKAPSQTDRKRQHLAIERNDFGDLVAEADLVLRRLITFGILDSGRAGFARDDEAKKPFYVLNRIYCPAFQIGFRRDEHLRLSKGKLELLLMFPERFVREGTRLLRETGGQGTDDMFGNGGG